MSSLTTTHSFVADLPLSTVHRITKWAIEYGYPFFTPIENNSKRIFTVSTFKTRPQFVAVRDGYETEYTNSKHTDTTQKERETRKTVVTSWAFDSVRVSPLVAG